MSEEFEGEGLEEGMMREGGEDQEEAKEYFVGEFTQEDVVERLKRLDEIEKEIENRLGGRFFGELKGLQEQLAGIKGQEIQISPEGFKRLREVDEGIANALVEDLKEALKVAQFDPSVVDQRTVPYVEQRILNALVPDFEQKIQSDEFGEWFWRVADQNIRDLFDAWDRGKPDGVGIANAIREFEKWKEEKEVEKSEKQKRVSRAREEIKGSQTRKGKKSPEEIFAEEAKKIFEKGGF